MDRARYAPPLHTMYKLTKVWQKRSREYTPLYDADTPLNEKTRGSASIKSDPEPPKVELLHYSECSHLPFDVVYSVRHIHPRRGYMAYSADHDGYKCPRSYDSLY